MSTRSIRKEWWKQLSDHLHASTADQLRQLRIRQTQTGVVVQATAPSHRIRELAEIAARQVIPGNFLTLAIDVTPDGKGLDGKGSDGKAAGAATPVEPRPTAAPRLASVEVHNRLRDLLEGRPTAF